MTRRKTIILTFLVAAFLTGFAASCKKQEVCPSSGISIDATISPHGYTKAVVSGPAFPQNATMGLFVCRHEEGEPSRFEEYNSKYNNLQAIQSSSNLSTPVWNYKYNGTGTAFPTLFLLMPQTGEKAADFYAYAPWISGTTKPTEIPFNLSNVPDLMYASENNTDSNRNKTPDGSEITISYHFVHKLAWIQCRFILNNGGSSNSSINAITVRRKSGGSTPLYAGGRFNGIKGTFNDESGITMLEASDSLRVSFNASFGTSGVDYNMLLVPETYQSDGDYELVFTMDGHRLETTYPIKVSDLRHSDGTAGFREGYRYVFTFTYDNFHHIHLSGTQVDTDADWTEFPEQKEIVI